MLDTFIALVDNKPGVLTRVAARHAIKVECGVCGLKARASLAQGEALGTRPSHEVGLKARAKGSVPHEPLIERDVVFREHRSHLRLEIAPSMMLRLVVDVPDERGPADAADNITPGFALGWGNAGLQLTMPQHSTITRCCRDTSPQSAAGFPWRKAA